MTLSSLVYNSSRIDAEPFHVRDQRGAFEPQNSRSAIAAAHAAFCFPEGTDDLIPIDGLKHFAGLFPIRVLISCGLGRSIRWRFEIRRRHMQYPARRQNDCALDDILQLTDVSRPFIPHQGSHRFSRDCRNGLVYAAAENLREVSYQQRNILGTLTQGRYLDRKDVQAIEQIGPKSLGVDHLGQVLVGGGDQSRIGSHGPGAPQPLEFSLLKNTEKLWLQLQRDLSDLIEKNGSMVCELKTSDALRDGSRERAPFMTKQFAFKKPCWDCRAIHFYERVLAPIAQ